MLLLMSIAQFPRFTVITEGPASTVSLLEVYIEARFTNWCIDSIFWSLLTYIYIYIKI